MTTITLRIDARQYEDYDDCLTAAAADVAEERGLEGYDLSPRWEDNERDTILVDVPAREFTAEDAAKYVQGWDSYDSIAATAEEGVADEDRYQLADAGYDPEQAAQVLRDYCRNRVANG